MHVANSSSLYLYFQLNQFKNFMIYDGNIWFKTNDKMLAHKVLFKNNINYLKNILNINDEKPKFFNFINFCTKIIINSTEKNNCIWMSTQNYGFNDIYLEELKNDKYVKIYNLIPSHKWVVLSFIKSLLFNNILRNKKNFYNIVLLKDNRKINDKFISDIVECNSDKIIFNTKDLLIDFINLGINKTISKFNYTKNLVKKTNPKKIYVHHLRWFETVSLAYSANKNSNPVILISHGSTPDSNYASSQFVLSKLASGMSYSEFADTTISHSPVSDAMIDRMNKNSKKFKINFWKLTSNLFKISKNENDASIFKKKIILHAGTSKNYSTRLWIYESTFEYINGLIKLINSISNLKDVELIIRLRSDIVSPIHSIVDLLPKANNVQFKTSGNFNDDLINSDLLITHFSTTTEQSLNLKIPVLLYGDSNRYYHLNGSLIPPTKDVSFPVYAYKNQNLSTFVKDILTFHDAQNVSVEKYNNLIWDDNSTLKNLIQLY